LGLLPEKNWQKGKSGKKSNQILKMGALVAGNIAFLLLVVNPMRLMALHFLCIDADAFYQPTEL